MAHAWHIQAFMQWFSALPGHNRITTITRQPGMQEARFWQA
jgi:hypothetical protein